MMKLRYVLVALLLAASGPSLAGSISFGNSFTSPGPFNDVYSFTLGSAGPVDGGVWELDLFSTLGIDKLKVTLNGAIDSSPDSFHFTGLSAGTYSLSVTGDVKPDWGFLDIPVGYFGTLSSRGDVTSVSVPEPGTLALFGLGLVGAAFAARRRTHHKLG